MTENQQELARYILEISMCGLIPLQGLKGLSKTDKEMYKYAALREDILVELGALVSLFMREEDPSRFPDDIETREAFQRLQDSKKEVMESLNHNVHRMLKFVKDEKRFSKYMDEEKSNKNLA